MYTQCPRCHTEITFEPPIKKKEGYVHRIKCPNHTCGAIICVDVPPASIEYSNYEQNEKYEKLFESKENLIQEEQAPIFEQQAPKQEMNFFGNQNAFSSEYQNEAFQDIENEQQENFDNNLESFENQVFENENLKNQDISESNNFENIEDDIKENAVNIEPLKEEKVFVENVKAEKPKKEKKEKPVKEKKSKAKKSDIEKEKIAASNKYKELSENKNKKNLDWVKAVVCFVVPLIYIVFSIIGELVYRGIMPSIGVLGIAEKTLAGGAVLYPCGGLHFYDILISNFSLMQSLFSGTNAIAGVMLLLQAVILLNAIMLFIGNFMTACFKKYAKAGNLILTIPSFIFCILVGFGELIASVVSTVKVNIGTNFATSITGTKILSILTGLFLVQTILSIVFACLKSKNKKAVASKKKSKKIKRSELKNLNNYSEEEDLLLNPILHTDVDNALNKKKPVNTADTETYLGANFDSGSYFGNHSVEELRELDELNENDKSNLLDVTNN